MWFCIIDGTVKVLVYEFVFEDILYGKSIVVGDDNIICDFDPETDFEVTERYIIGRYKDYVLQYTFDKETKVVN